MLESIVLVQMIIMGVCVLAQPSMPRAIVSFIFIFPILLHDEFFQYFSSNPTFYYMSSFVLASLSMIVIANLKDIPKLAVDIQIILLISIIFDGFGLTMDLLKYESTLYSGLFVLLYSWAIFKLTRKEQGNVGNYHDSSFIHPLRCHSC